jgi:serine/threonine-protein kinase
MCAQVVAAGTSVTGRSETAPAFVPGYELKRKIAEGGCAEIYEGREALGSREVAIKILHPRHLNNKAEYKRLLNEGAIGKRLGRHEHVIETLASGMAGKLPYVVLELLPGRTLRELLRVRKRLSTREIVELSKALGHALRFLHNAGVYHRDLKPENVMLGAKAPIRVIDLGFAESRLAVTFSIFGRRLDGSPAYMAPEYIRTRKPTFATDVYALGCTLYEVATGHTPMTGASDREVMRKQLNQDLPAEPVRNLNPKISRETEKLIMNAVEKDPARRYRSADEFLLELSRNELSGEPSRGIAVPEDWPDRTGRQPDWRRPNTSVLPASRDGTHGQGEGTTNTRQRLRKAFVDRAGCDSAGC